MAQAQALSDFLFHFKGFCDSSGQKLPVSCQETWVSWWGPLKVDLRALFDVVQQHPCLDDKTPAQIWRAVWRSISGDAAASLPPERMQQLFLKHFAGFKDYVQQRTNKTRELDTHHQMQQQQQKKTVPQGQGRKQKFCLLNCHSPHKKQALEGKSAADKPAAPMAANPYRGSTTHKSGSGCSTSAAGVDVQPTAGVRRSGRTRTQAVRQGYVSSTIIPSESGSDSDSELGSDSGTDSASDAEAMSIGPAHQAVLPQLQRRPASEPTAAEAKFLSKPLYNPGSQPQQPQLHNPGLTMAPGEFRALWEKAGSGPARLQLLESWIQRMDDHIGQEATQSLGLSWLGYKLKATWAYHEELLFALSMLDRYRMFQHMHRCYLPKRSVHELNSYYYNVWKPRAGDIAEEFAQLCERDGDPVEFRVQLCTRLAAIWDAAAMGPIPNSAALPPGIAANTLSAAADRSATAASQPAKALLARNAAGKAALPSSSSAKAAVLRIAQAKAAVASGISMKAAVSSDAPAKAAAAASGSSAAVQRVQPLLVADATAQVAASASNLKRPKLAAHALQPVYPNSREKSDTLSPSSLRIVGRRMASGLQRVPPVDAAATDAADACKQGQVPCGKSPVGAEGVDWLDTVQQPAVEGMLPMSHSATAQRQQGTWQSPVLARKQQQSGGLVAPYPTGSVQQPQQQQQQQQQLTPITAAGPDLHQREQQHQLPESLLSQAAMQSAAGGTAALAATRACHPAPGSQERSSRQAAASSDGGGCQQADCQAQSVDVKHQAGTVQPGGQAQTDSQWPCISLLGPDSDANTPDRALKGCKLQGDKCKLNSGSDEATAAHNSCRHWALLHHDDDFDGSDDVGDDNDVICILD